MRVWIVLALLLAGCAAPVAPRAPTPIEEPIVTTGTGTPAAPRDGPRDAERGLPKEEAFNVSVARSFKVVGACTDPRADPDGAAFHVTPPGGERRLEQEYDVLWRADPWDKSRRFEFAAAGTAVIEWACTYDDGHESSVAWQVTVHDE